MKNLKKHPRKQLEKFSTVFMQLGLVLTLFVVYVVIEYQTKVKEPIEFAYEPTDKPYEVDFTIPVIIKEVKVKQKKEPVQKKRSTDLSDPEIVDNEPEVIENVIDKPKDIEPQIIDPDNIDEVIIDEPLEPETVPFLIIEDAPIYRGCEGLSKEENKKCFLKKMSRHVQRNFNAELAQDLGLRSGKHKMYAQFVIDKKGDVKDIQVSAAYRGLQKEAVRVVKKVPQFTPGMQRKKPVKVKYTLPITFYIE